MLVVGIPLSIFIFFQLFFYFKDPTAYLSSFTQSVGIKFHLTSAFLSLVMLIVMKVMDKKSNKSTTERWNGYRLVMDQEAVISMKNQMVVSRISYKDINSLEEIFYGIILRTADPDNFLIIPKYIDRYKEIYADLSTYGRVKSFDQEWAQVKLLILYVLGLTEGFLIFSLRYLVSIKYIMVISIIVITSQILALVRLQKRGSYVKEIRFIMLASLAFNILYVFQRVMKLN